MAAPQDYFQRIDLTDGDTMMDRSGDNVREDFMDAIYNISPTQTVFMSMIGRGTSSDVYTSWQQDELAEPNDANAAKDGADIGADGSSKARRVGNINQISTKSLITSGRADTVNKAGRSTEMSYQLAKAAKALKRDQEAILTGNQAATPDADGDTASLLGGLRACFRDAESGETTTALVNTGSTGANGGVNPGTTYTPAAATDAAATRALTETLLRSSIEACYMNGGEPDTIMVSPTLKTVISTYLFTSSARVAALFSDVGQGKSGGATAQGSVDIYISDFGAMKIVPNRYLGYDTSAHAPRNRDMFVLDPSLWSVLYLRPYRVIDVAKSGDATKKLLPVDYTLQFKQEMGSGGVFDIDHTTPMTA
jgi:hypothetical protein